MIFFQRADLGLAGLTITYQREQVFDNFLEEILFLIEFFQAIDFTKPFLTLGINILFKKAQRVKPKLFGFFQPLSIDVWLYMIAAYFGSIKFDFIF
jgi:ionotropic kainate glutamate receptor 2